MALLGCIADDFTGATDLCNTLVKQGMRTVQLIDVPADDAAPPGNDSDAIVVALKSRSCPTQQAIDDSLAALRWLRQRADCRQFFFKYCSTFDSTDAGNIGPVADALLEALGDDFSIACPAFPETGRTIFHGHLFVNDQLLSDSPLKDHPLNPMTDSNLVRVLGRQTSHPVGLVRYADVRRGAEAVTAAIADLRTTGTRYAVVDAVRDEHLIHIGHACSDLKLITGGSGIALGLPDNFRRQGLLTDGDHDPAALPEIVSEQPPAVIAGSCSQATLAQIAHWQLERPSFELLPLALATDANAVREEALAWARQNLARGPVLLYASAPPEQVREAQQQLGRERAGELIEHALAAIATGLVEHGVRQLVVAGGETSGAVVQALGVRGLQIGAQIDPGVPWTVSLDAPSVQNQRIALALKSGNFGGEDFFLKALQLAP